MKLSRNPFVRALALAQSATSNFPADTNRKRLSARHASFRLGSLISLSLLVSHSAQAAIFLWDGGGGDNNWSTTNNWNPNGAPPTASSANDIQFGGGTRLAPNMQASYTINSLTFNNGAGLFVLTNTGGTTLTIQGGGIVNNENSLETINISNITLGAAQTWSAASGALTVSSAVDNNGNLLTINAAQATILSGAIIGGGGLTKNGTNTLTLSGASANTYSGLTTVNTGTLTLNKTAGVTSIAGNLTIGDGAGTDTVTVAASNQIADASVVTINSSGVLGLNALVTETIGSLTMTAGSVTTGTGTLTLGGDVTGNANANSATITGNLNLGGVVRTFTLADGGAADDMAISAIISNGSITKEGAGTLFLNGANTYTGAVLVNAGTLQLGNILGLGTTAGGATVAAGAVLDLNGIAVGAEAVTLNGTGISSGGALINSSGTAASLSGTVALDTDSSVGGSGTLNLSGVISGSAIGLTKVGAGNLTFSGASANTYSGLTTVNAGTLTLSKTAGVTSIAGDLTIGDGTGTDTVTLTTANQIADTSAVTINAGGVLGLGTVSDTIGSLTMTAGSVTGTTGTLTLGGNVTGNANAASATISSLLNLGGATRTFTIADGAIAIDMTISGVISNGGLTKAGAGTLTLSGVNTFGGVLTVEAGNLSVATINNVSTAGTLGNSAGAVVLGGSGTTGTLQYTGADVTSTKSFTMATAGTGVLQIDAGGTELTLNSVVDGSGALTKTGAGGVIFSGASANTYSGLTTVNAGTLTLSKTAGVTSIAGDLTIGDGSGTDTVTLTTANQIADTSAVTINAGGVLGLTNVSDTIGSLTMTAGSVTTGTGTLTLSGDVTGNANAASATITGNLSLGGVARTFTLADGAAADDMSISAIISSGSITKEGAGTLLLSGASTYTGAVLINTGTVKLGNILGLGTVAGGATVTAGAVLDLNGIAVGAEALTLNGTGISSGGALINSNGTAASLSGTVALNTDSSVGGSGALNLSGVISGSAIGLTKVGTGNLTFSGASANTYSGLTTVNTGTLTLSKTAGVTSIAGDLTIGDGSGTDTVTLTTANQIADASAITINAGGVLGLTNVSDTIGTLTMTAGGVTTGTGTLTLGGNVTGNANAASATITGNLALGATRTFTIADGGAADDMSISALISGATFGITKEGAGTLLLSGGNTYTGAVLINTGTVKVGNILGLGTVAGGATVTAGAVLDLNGIAVGAEALTLNGDGISSGGALINSSGTAASLSGTVALNTDSSVGGSGNLTLSGVISGSAIGLTKVGAANLTFSGAAANTYSGLTTVNTGTLTLNKTAGVTSIAGDLIIGDGTGTDTVTLTTANQIADTSAVTINAGGVLGLTNVSDTIGTLTMTAGSVTTGTGTLTLGGNVTGNANAASATISGNLALGATRTFTIADGAATADMSISAIISGATFGVTKEGAGTLTLGGANTYTGLTDIQAGTLALGASGVFANASTLKVSGGTLSMLTFSDTVAGVQLTSGSITGSTGVLTSTTAFDLQAGSVGAILGGSAGATKTTAGTVTLSGANTYTGLTDVQVGTLALGASNVFANTSTLKVSGGTLSLGANSDTVGGVQLTAGSITSSTGVLTSTAAFDLQAGSASAILGGTAGANKTTAGTVTLSGVNTYTGVTSVDVGTLRATTSANSLGAGTLDMGGGTLELANDTGLAFNRNTTVSASSTIKSDILTPTGVGVTHTLGTLTFASAQTLTISAGGNVGSGTAGITFGSVTIDAGSPTFSVGSGSQLTMGAIDSGSTADRTITFGGAGNTLVSGIIDDATGGGNTTFVTKSGTGTLTLSAANTYTDTTTISAGTLLANNASGSATGTGAISVAAAGILGGSGTITPGAANGISVTGVLAPGASVGTIGNLTLNLGSTTGTVVMNSGASFQYDLGVAGIDINTVGTSDLLTLAGAAASNFAFASNTIDFLGSGGIGYYKLFDTSFNATTWTGLTVGGTGLITAGLNISNLTSGLTGNLIMGGNSLGGTAGDIYLQVIPEPSAALLAGIGSLLLLRRRVA